VLEIEKKENQEKEKIIQDLTKNSLNSDRFDHYELENKKLVQINQ